MFSLQTRFRSDTYKWIERVSNYHLSSQMWIRSKFSFYFFSPNRTNHRIIFLKHPGALGSHLRILGAHVDRTQRRRDCPNSLGTRHTETLTPHARAHTHSRLSTREKIPRRVTLEHGIGGLHTWSAHHPSYDSVPSDHILARTRPFFYIFSGWVQYSSCRLGQVHLVGGHDQA